MMEAKYLYYYTDWGSLERVEIVNETPCFYQLKNHIDKISKKHMRSGSRWNWRNYEVETPILVEEYKTQFANKEIKQKFKDIVSKVQQITDFAKMSKITEMLEQEMKEGE